MALPVGWPPRQSPDYRTLRFFKSSTSTANFADNAYLFGTDAAGAPVAAGNVTPMPYVEPGDTSPTNLANPPYGGGRDAHDNTVVPMRYSGTIRIRNDSAVPGDSIEFSFDGTNVHGEVKAGEDAWYGSRYEAGIAVRTKAASGHCVFRVEAW